ncbi:DNA repair exonuclease SbcCD nuclease subunit [Loktanella sp. DSM 29012]|uniref:metallophosphoesterase family protein n=1 Tax=Loktanella sp. DSM 29012 TaxID=1881056 RepID=UPI0008D2478B|nr:DNA repair exonuclease [Loktanella sp. DSM 29012]SEQ40021.1 DNA repair exonuclease SbcCD nuclease subunit [Loktanella sp. DSM 29012]
MIKILHTADVHLDSPLKSLALRDPDLRDRVIAATRTAFARIVDVALDQRVSAVLIAGDLFDGQARSARTGAFLTSQLDRLSDAGIRVFYIKGNHDADNPVTGQIDLPGNVHVFDARGGKVALADDLWIHGVSFAGRTAPDSLLPRFSAPVRGAVNIAMLHTSLAGAAGHDPYAPCALSDLTGAGFDYWALGHVHGRQVHATDPWVVMPGMPQGRDIGEAGPKTASLLTIDQGRITVETVATSVVEFIRSTIDITDAGDGDGLRTMLRNHVQDNARGLHSDTSVMRLTLTGTPARYWQILRDADLWTEQLTQMLLDTGVLWLDRLVLDVQAPSSEADQTSATAELTQTMADLTGDPAFAAAARALVADTLGDLPASLRARLMPDETAIPDLTARLSERGARRVTAMMKGAVD